MRTLGLLFFLVLLFITCATLTRAGDDSQTVQVGAARFERYLPRIAGKRVALVVNHTALLGQTHLADTLLKRGVNIVKIFAPEHGFRGNADAGEDIQNGKDSKTGLPLVSLYGKKHKPSAEDLADVDVVVFDIQDVGARFYSYISTLFYLLQACAEQGKTCLVLDRPNPNGHFVDGPILEKSQESFVGIAPLPIAHGCTVGELAKMFVGEGWLKTAKPVDLQVVTCRQYNHRTRYALPVKPSPNMPDMRSVYLYPSLCLFEGTVASVGRGTEAPFQQIGWPGWPDTVFSFTPKPNSGAKKPLYEGKKCFGKDFRGLSVDSLSRVGRVDLSLLLEFFRRCPDKQGFFLANKFFDKLAGTAALREQILAGKTESEICESWQPGLSKFKVLRKKYLLYPDFE